MVFLPILQVLILINLSHRLHLNHLHSFSIIFSLDFFSLSSCHNFQPFFHLLNQILINLRFKLIFNYISILLLFLIQALGCLVLSNPGSICHAGMKFRLIAYFNWLIKYFFYLFLFLHFNQFLPMLFDFWHIDWFV